MARDGRCTTNSTLSQRVRRPRHIGITLQIDEGLEVFDARHSNLHPLFNKT